jgi:ferrochelatase
MSTGILMLAFGEPATPTLASVERYLEGIFLMNASLEGQVETAAADRARHLAQSRAPALLAEYAAIGGSPLNAEAHAQAEALERELMLRGKPFRVYTAFQFVEPYPAEAVRAAREDGVDTLVALPVYPLCGRTTTVAALDAVRSALGELRWAPRFIGLAGWHHHPAYASLRADHIRMFVQEVAST